MNPQEDLAGHGFDTDTLKLTYFTAHDQDEETFFDKLMRFFVAQDSEVQ